MVRYSGWWFFLVLTAAMLCISWDIGAALAAGVAQLDSSNPMTWLVKSVCTSAQNLAMPVDPYNGCPESAGIRKIQSGDPLPYSNVEQIGYQQRDAYPVHNPVGGKTWIIATFDYAPFNQFNLFNGTDGYDIYTLQNGWASIADTSDGGGYGQTFYSTGCGIGGGWVLFPAAGFLKGGKTTAAIADVYWEQGGQSYPGACPAKYSTTTQTSWTYQAGFPFGGVNGNPVKPMDTVISYHGFRPSPGFLTHGHLEVFYFTREYGITRWEVWTPTAQHPSTTTECRVPATPTYQGVSFVVQHCHDWSHVVPASTAQRPVWPIPNINLLAKPHFDGAITGAWHSEGQSTIGKPIDWTVKNSTASRDTRASTAGVRYLRLDCAAGSTGQCGAGASEAIYQDIPTSSIAGGADYAFGINARTEPGQGQGTIAVAVQQIDGSGRVIANTTHTASAAVLPDNGTPGRESAGEPGSVYLSSRFVYGTLVIAPQPDAAKIRFLISPRTPQTFDVLDAWLAAWPMPTGLAAAL
ncbi:MAG TPA: hypothetical protein VGM07_05870 [Stellaceae bacterium]|jgi:hypothetical protein